MSDADCTPGREEPRSVAASFVFCQVNNERHCVQCRDSSNLLEAGRRPVRSQIPLRYLVADRLEAGRGPVADLLARASSLLAS